MGEKIQALKEVLKNAVEIFSKTTRAFIKDSFNRLSRISWPKISSAGQLLILGIMFLVGGIVGTLVIASFDPSLCLAPFLVGIVFYVWFIAAGSKIRNRICN